jgi:hypothetical protein
MLDMVHVGVISAFYGWLEGVARRKNAETLAGLPTGRQVSLFHSTQQPAKSSLSACSLLTA